MNYQFRYKALSSTMSLLTLSSISGTSIVYEDSHGNVKSASVRCCDINQTLFTPWCRAGPRGWLVSATRPTGLASCSLDRGRPAVYPVHRFGYSMHGEIST